MKQSTTLKLTVAVFLVLITCLPALAHKVRIFAWEDSGTIVAESKFSGGRPAKNANVSVINIENGQQLLSGTTDADGVFRFPIPSGAGSVIDIVVDGGDGHKNSWQFILEESPNTDETTPHVHSDIQTAQPSQTITLSENELQRIVEEALDKKLGPIKRTLAESTDHGPSLQDILGGIGYILGLAGVATYFQSRRKDKE